jgi:uncharacterized protein YfbU (UPF0304 family)
MKITDNMTISDFVSQNILQNQTSLVSLLLNSEQAGEDRHQNIADLGYSYEQMNNFQEYIEVGNSTMTRRQIELRIEELEKELSHIPNESQQTVLEQLKEALEEDGQYPEVFSWYLVTDYLYDKLTEEGEVTLDTSSGKYWGRCTYGQLIENDFVIENIFESINK